VKNREQHYAFYGLNLRFFYAFLAKELGGIYAFLRFFTLFSYI